MLRSITLALTRTSASLLCLKLLEFTVNKGSEIADLKTTTHSILRRLRDTELGLLLKALESRGGDVSSCVYFPYGEKVCKRVVHEPHVVLYRTFREPNVQSSNELKPLAICSRRDSTGKRVCINPHHYSEIIQIQSPTPELQQNLSPKPHTKQDESSGFGSNFTETQSTDCSSKKQPNLPLSISELFESTSEWPSAWCVVAYWELNECIGPFYHGHQDVINIYETLPKPKGFCLAGLDRNQNVSDGTKRARNHVGFGLQLSREEDGIWIYNRSEYAVFANGTTFPYVTTTPSASQNITVTKVPPGFSLKIYDYNHSPATCRTFEGPQSWKVPESVRISFAKGWGNTSSASYRRPVVTSCPCWLEIHFTVSR
ncbi:mothers against decapentaplegic homolog 6 [Nematostella vectensis]|uniref:mothers against decapentaplegic homolog 6 n=1 Tax=Nematostella vectensis TaxID=45351 RepID=UPI00138FF260|nr:mothers against decapentaplegic homolog 6 [Nematostella vectensis]